MSAFGTRVRDWSIQFQALNGAQTYAGTITNSTASALDNNNTAVTFAFQGGEQVLLQPDTACYVIPLAQSNANAVTTKMVLLQANEKYYLLLPSAVQGTAPAISMIPVSGTTNLKVFTQA